MTIIFPTFWPRIIAKEASRDPLTLGAAKAGVHEVDGASARCR
ncbi:hypothetical protein [Streptomyces sp. MMG1533]|nr:hypothetical protein [Streptomyces sp. MMG1533]